MDSQELLDGAFRRRDAVQYGVSDGALRTSLALGESARAFRGVYTPEHLTDPVSMAGLALLGASPGHVAIDRTAAAIHGLDVFTAAERAAGPPVELAALRGHQPSELTGVDGRTRDLGPEDITVVDGLRVTTPLRTALDLGCQLHRPDAFAALNHFAARGVSTVALRRELPRFRGRRGVVQLRELIGLIEPRVESVRESWTLLALLDAGLPRPTAQFAVEGPDGRGYRLDFAYPLRLVAIEYDGYADHLRSADQAAEDRARRAWLGEHGWTVIVVRRGDFSGARLRRWLDEVRVACGSSYSNRRF